MGTGEARAPMTPRCAMPRNRTARAPFRLVKSNGNRVGKSLVTLRPKPANAGSGRGMTQQRRDGPLAMHARILILIFDLTAALLDRDGAAALGAASVASGALSISLGLQQAQEESELARAIRANSQSGSRASDVY